MSNTSEPRSAAGPTSSAARPRARRLGFALGAWVLAVIMFASNMVVLSLVGKPENPFAPTPAAFAAALLLNVVWAIVMVGLVLVRIGGLSLTELGWRLSPLGRSLATGAAGFVVAASLLLLLMTANGADPLVEARAWLTASLAERGLWLLIGVGAAFIEESVFRGMLQTVLVQRLGRVSGVLLTACLFSYPFTPCMEGRPRSASCGALRLCSGAHVLTYAPLRCSLRLPHKAACGRGFLGP